MDGQRQSGTRGRSSLACYTTGKAGGGAGNSGVPGSVPDHSCPPNVLPPTKYLSRATVSKC